MPPPGINPLVRILIYQSSFLSPNSKDAALLIHGANLATPQYYRLEVVIANSTIRAEQAAGSENIFALQFTTIHLANANLSVYGCHIAAITAADRTSLVLTAFAIFFTSSPITNSTVQLLSSTLEACSGDGFAQALVFSDCPLTDTHVNISGSVLNATSGGFSRGISFLSTPLYRGTVRLFGTHIISQSTGTTDPTYGFYTSGGSIINSSISMHGGSLTAMGEWSFAVHIESPVPQKVHVFNSILSFHGAALLTVGDGTAVFRLSNVFLAGAAIEVIGGSIRHNATKHGSIDGCILDFAGTVTKGSTIRITETAIVCEYTVVGTCAFLKFFNSQVNNTLVGIYGGSLILSAHTSPYLWRLMWSSDTTNTSFVLSRCDARLIGEKLVHALLLDDTSSIGAGTTLFWNFSSFTAEGGTRQHLSSTYRCEGTPCPNLAVRIDDTSTPPMPSTCPHCLAPYGAPDPFDDGSGYDHSVPSVGCLLWVPTASYTPRLTLTASETYAALRTKTTTQSFPSASLSLSVPSSALSISVAASQSLVPLQTSSPSISDTAFRSCSPTETAKRTLSAPPSLSATPYVNTHRPSASRTLASQSPTGDTHSDGDDGGCDTPSSLCPSIPSVGATPGGEEATQTAGSLAVVSVIAANPLVMLQLDAVLSVRSERPAVRRPLFPPNEQVHGVVRNVIRAAAGLLPAVGARC